MNNIRKFEDNIKKKFPPGKNRRWAAMLGNINGVVDAGDGKSYVRTFDGQTLKLPNATVSPVAQPVKIGYTAEDPETLRVIGPWYVHSNSASVDQHILDHHEDHEYPAFGTVWVKTAQFQWLNCLPVSLFTIQVYGGVVPFDGGYVTVNDQLIDITDTVTLPTSGALYVLLQCDNSGIVTTKEGAAVSMKELLTDADIPFEDNGFFPLFAVALYDSQTKLQRGRHVDDFKDLRFGRISETDPLSLHLDQTTPQTFINLGGGTGLMKVTAGLLGLDTNTYISTGIISGGVLSIGTPNSRITITDGTGVIVDPSTGIMTQVSWTGLTNVVITNIAIQPLTYFKINSAGTLVQGATAPTGIDAVDFIVIGVAVHADLATVSSTQSFVNQATNMAPRFRDLTRALGRFSISGNVFSANGANLLLNKSSGVSYESGANWPTSMKNPDVISVPSQTGMMLVKITRSTTIGLSTSLDPNNYDLNGVLTAVSVQRWTIQHVTMFSDGITVVQYGQTEYLTFNAAAAVFENEVFVTSPTVEFGVFRAHIIIKKGSTNLAADIAAGTARIIEAGKFGTTGGGTGASTTTLQQAYDNSPVAEILTDATRGALTVKRGSAADTDAVFEGQNGAGDITSSITGEGVATVASLNINNPANTFKYIFTPGAILADRIINIPLLTATDTLALLSTQNIFLAAQKISVNSTTAFFVEQDGVKDNTFIVNTTDGTVAVGMVPVTNFKLSISATMQLKNSSGSATFYVDRSAVTAVADYKFATGGVIDWDYGMDSGSVRDLYYYSRSGAGFYAMILRYATGNLGIGIQSPAAIATKMHVMSDTAATNTVVNVMTIEQQSTGTPANGLGVGLVLALESSTTVSNLAGLISASWIDATHATRKAKLSLSAYDTAARLGLEIEASGSAAKLGFFGVTPAVRPSAYTITNDSADRALDCNSTSLDELADVVGSLVKDLQSIGILG